jgi:hypothetical protein
MNVAADPTRCSHAPTSPDTGAALARLRERVQQMAGELAELSRQLTDLSQAIEDHQANPGHRFTRPYQAGRTHDRRAAPTPIPNARPR